jgi:hypothetical protein
MRLAHPGKAVICSSADSDPVAILLGGGSLAPLGTLDDTVARAVVAMTPEASADDAGVLREPGAGRRTVLSGPDGIVLIDPRAGEP